MSHTRLLILACSAVKRPDAQDLSAIDRYNGPLWQTLRATDPEACGVQVAFLSAERGFGMSWHYVKDYDRRLTAQLAATMIERGILNDWPPPKNQHRRTMGGRTAMSVLASAASRYDKARGYWCDPFVDVAICGGSLYVEVMRSFVSSFRKELSRFRKEGVITSDAPLLEINAPIGQMRQQLRAWLTAKSAKPAQAA